jgi:hypothetical protein
MNAVKIPKRKDGRSSFTKLVTYVSLRDDKKLTETLSPDMPFVRPSRSNEVIFDRLVDYMAREEGADTHQMIAMSSDGRQQVRCGDVMCETNCFSLETAAAEMNMVSHQNVRCKDPVLHYVLSWREEDNPQDRDILDSARYVLKQLGMADHQYVSAIHRDTDNVHCHIAVNIVNPISYRVADISYDADTLQKACRRLEYKYGWTPDNGSWVLDDKQQLVRTKREFRPAPKGARELELFADCESFHAYVVGACRDKIDALVNQNNVNWLQIHEVLIEANLDLKPKGKGLAIYHLDDPRQTPIKASSLHPKLTLSHLEPKAGEFTPAPKVTEFRNESGHVLLRNYAVNSRYDSLLHKRDRGARQTRRIERAEAREDLKARYQAYKNAWIKPAWAVIDTKARYQEMAQDFRMRKTRVRLTTPDPLLRKLMYRMIEVERMQATIALRDGLKAERNAIRMLPDSRPLSYRGWVEQEALRHDQAAVSQLRGWAYREKRSERTAALSKVGLACAVADDIKPFEVEGYTTKINRDGAILYQQNGVTAVVDRGPRIEIADPYVKDSLHLVLACHLADKKSGEHLSFRGDGAYLSRAYDVAAGFNHTNGTPLNLTDAGQRMKVGGYEPADRLNVSAQRQDNVDKPQPRYVPPRPR